MAASAKEMAASAKDMAASAKDTAASAMKFDFLIKWLEKDPRLYFANVFLYPCSPKIFLKLFFLIIFACAMKVED